MDDRNLIKVVAAIVTVCLVACSFWYYTKNQNYTKTFKIDISKNASVSKELNKLTKDETSRVSSQDGSVNKTSKTEDSSNVMIKSSQASSYQEQDGVKIKYSGTLPQEYDSDILNNSSVGSEPETSQTASHKVGSINAHEPEVNGQPENSEGIPNIPQTYTPTMQTGFNNTTTPNTASEISSQSDIDEEEEESVAAESLHKDACVQTEPQVSRSILLNDQLPICIPLPKETASDMLNEFRCSNAVHAFTGQDLIEFEDYDEEEEIRRFLFRKNN